MQTIFKNLQRLRTSSTAQAVTPVSMQRHFSRQVAKTRAGQKTAQSVKTIKAVQPAAVNFGVSAKDAIHRGKYAKDLPDYSNDPTEFQLSSVMKKELTNQEYPLDVEAAHARSKAEIFGNLSPTQVLFTNLPTQIEYMRPFGSRKSVYKYLLENVHKDLDVLDVNFVNALVDVEARKRVAYIIVNLGSKRQAQMVAQKLKKTWLGDHLLKLKLAEDATRESFNNRTVLIQGIPDHLTTNKVLEIFGKDDGAITGVELPTENEEVANAVAARREADKETDKTMDLKRAQIAIQESLDVDLEYRKVIEDNLQAGELNQLLLTHDTGAGAQSLPSLAAEKKLESLLKIITHLQAEGKQVVTSKYSLQKLQDLAQPSVEADGAKNEITENAFRKQVEAAQPQLEQIVTYLKTNGHSFREENPLDKLLHLSRGEIALAYDELVVLLEQRENVVEERLRSTIEHFGASERIIIEGKNFVKELEDVPVIDKMPGKFSPENILSLQEQINGVLRAKNLNSQEKLQRLLMTALNPFGDKNFSKEMLFAARSNDLDDAEFKKMEIPDPRLTKGMHRMMGISGSDLRPKVQEELDQMIGKIREDMDLPFDEIYHKEKAVVQAVIDADKALKDKQASLKNPLESIEVDPAYLSKDLRAMHSSPFELSQLKEQDRVMKSRLDALDGSDAAGSYDFATRERNSLDSMLERGLISQKDYNRFKKVQEEAQIRNLGYVFLTFSHADEARQFLIKSQNAYFDGRKMSVELKQRLEHSDMDVKYSTIKMENEAQLINELQKLREVRQELRDFEGDIESHLPKTKKLKALKKNLRNLIDTDKDFTRHHEITNTRTELEEDKFKEKIKDLEAKYPHVDFTTLFDTDRAEDARQALHKKAFASYKAYKFLKAGVAAPGVTETPKQLSKAKQRLQDNDPYNFPELDRAVSQVMSPGVLTPQLNDGGDRIYQPGRRFKGFTEREYLDAFFGKDHARRVNMVKTEDSVFHAQEALKVKFPKSQFLKMPEIKRREEAVKKLGFDMDRKNYTALEPQDKEIADAFTNHFKYSDPADETLDLQHPTAEEEEGRTMNSDYEKMINNYMKQRERRGLEGTIDLNEISYIKEKIQAEYSPPSRFQDWHTMMMRDDLRDLKEVHPEEEEAEAGAEGGDELKEAKFEGAYDDKDDKEVESKEEDEFQPLTRTQQRINNDYIYHITKEPESMKTNTIMNELVEEEENMTQGDIYSKWFKDSSPIKEGGDQYGGSWFAKHEGGVKINEAKDTGVVRPGKKLQDFFGTQDSDLSEREEQDIYEHYREQSRTRAAVEETETRDEDLQFTLDKELLQPDMPRFDGYFNSLAKGTHPFDKITSELEEQEIKGGKATPEDIAYEKELYQRELVGRFYGEKLTPRQFELISGQYRDTDAKIGRVKDVHDQVFIKARDKIRLFEELMEKHRRTQVLNGVWKEEESYDHLQVYLEEAMDEYTGPHTERIRTRQEIDLYETYTQLDNPERLMEKEYHFDEGLGESLADHTSELKKNFPGMKVETRRDRDGFAIVKTSFAPEYKYNLDEILNFDSDKSEQHNMQTIEEILNSFIPEGAQQRLEEMSSEEFQEKVQKLVQPDLAGSSQQLYEFDGWTRMQLSNLFKERASGQYKDDVSGFVQRLSEVTADASFDTQKPVRAATAYSNFLNADKGAIEQSFEDLFEDRDRIKNEIADQLAKKVRKHNLLTKRKEEDLVKFRANEKDAYVRQQYSNDNRIGSLETLTSELGGQEDQADFDKDAYYKLKEELTQRKEAKERLLSTGLPEFKAYLRF